MFVDFNRIFGEPTKDRTNKIPSVLKDYLDSTAPKGTHYKLESDGTFNLEPIPGVEDLHIQGLVIEDEKALREKLGDEYNLNSIGKYAYNSQQEIYLKPMVNNEIYINGVGLSVEKFVIIPNRKKKHTDNDFRFLIKPSNFPEPRMLELSNGKFKCELLITRIPNDSLHEVVYETLTGAPLGLKFIFDETKDSMNLRFRTNLSNETSVRKYVEVYSLCASFLDGSMCFNGMALGQLNFDRSNVEFSMENLLFWEKVLKIEEALGVTFQPEKISIANTVLNTVEELYQTVIEKHAIRCSFVINSFNTSDKESYEQLKNERACLLFRSSSKYELFNKVIELPCLYAVFNSKISLIEKAESKYRITLQDENPESVIFVSKYNLESEDSEISLEEMDTAFIEGLRTALRPSEYLSK